MKKIIYIADPEILAIPIVECGETLVDLKDQCIILFGETPECELTKNDYTKMRKSVYEKLCLVQADLPNHYQLRLYEGFRSLKVQKILFDHEYQKIRKKFPDENLKNLFHETTRLVSPVINFDGTTNIPPHNTGAAVDVEIIDQHGKLKRF